MKYDVKMQESDEELLAASRVAINQKRDDPPVVDTVQIWVSTHVKPPARVLVVSTIPNERIIVPILSCKWHIVVPAQRIACISSVFVDMKPEN